MPRQVEKQISARAVRKGMEFRWRNEWWGVDEDPINKTVYTYIDVGNTEPFRIPSGAMVNVRVTEATPQENYDRLLERVESMLVVELRGALPARLTALDNLRSDNDPGYWEIDRWFQAKAKYKIWVFFSNVLALMDGSGAKLEELIDRADPGDMVSCLEDVIGELRREVWRKPGRSGMLVAEAQSQTEIDIKREFVDHWQHLLDQLHHFAAEIEKEQADA